MKLSRVGVDLAKNVYQLHGVDRHGKMVWKRRLKRHQWLQVLLDKTEPDCVIGMEACAGAHHWGRECPSSNKWNRSTFRLSECFAHHFHVTRHAVGSANDVSRWSSS